MLHDPFLMKDMAKVTAVNYTISDDFPFAFNWQKTY
jgi:hypothetical protein